jgi:hypothetical protein
MPEKAFSITLQNHQPSFSFLQKVLQYHSRWRDETALVVRSPDISNVPRERKGFMKMSISRWIAPAVLALGLTGGVVGATSGAAFATTTKSASGTIKTVSTTTDVLTMTVSKKTDTFHVNDMTKVTLGGKTSKFADLKAKDTATVKYTASGTTWTATSIAAKTA